MSYSLTIKPKPISEFVRELIIFYLPKGGVIYDPTCGKENHQFKWLKGQKIIKTLTGYEYKYICSDIQNFPHVDFTWDFLNDDNLHLPEKSVDLVLYDPPFLMFARNDKRQNDYNINEDRSIEEVKQYYKSYVLEKFAKLSKKWVIVKGEDQYYPATSYNLYPFSDLIEKPDGLILHAVYVYRMMRSEFPLYRDRMRYYQRPLKTHTYYYVYRVKGFEPEDFNYREIKEAL